MTRRACGALALLGVACIFGSPFAVAAGDLADALSLLEDGRYARAEALARQLLDEAQERHGIDSLESARVLDALVTSLWRQGKARRPETGAFAEQALAIKLEKLGPDHPGVAVSLQNLGVLANIAGEPDTAIAFQERSLKIREGALGPDHPDVGEALFTLSNALRAAGRFTEALEAAQRGLAIRERALGPDHFEVSMGLVGVCNALWAIGDYTRAKVSCERAVAIQEAQLRPDHPTISLNLGNLAVIHGMLGETAEAKRVRLRALAIAERSLGPESPSVATQLSNLAVLLVNTGDFVEARELHERALAIRRKSLGPAHPQVAGSLHNLGMVHRSLGNRETARELIQRGLEMRRQLLGPDHVLVGFSLHALGHLLLEEGDPGKAAPLARQALSIQEAALGPHHPELAWTLSTLAMALAETGELEEARAQALRALTILETALGPRHPAVADILEDLAGILLLSGRSSAALDAALRSEEISREHLGLTVQSFAERHAVRYAAKRTTGLDLALSLVAEDSVGGMEVRREVWDALVRSRALVLDEMASRQRAVLDMGDPASSRLREELASSRQRLANLSVAGPRGSGAGHYRRLLESTRAEKERLEEALAERSLRFREDRVRSRVGFFEVMRWLPRGSALVAYARYEQESGVRPGAARGAGTSYSAFVLRGGNGNPELVRLGEAERIERAVTRWGKEASEGATAPGWTAAESEAAYREAGTTLRELVWDPLVAHLEGARLVFVVPDGVLHGVSLAALTAPGGGYLIEEGPLVHYLSAERDLVPVGRQPPRGTGLLAVGAPAFGSGSRADVALMETFRGVRGACGDLESLVFEPLPGSRREARDVARMWKRRGSGATALLVGAEASEGAFKAKAPNKRVLHVATHGYFLDGMCPTGDRDGRAGGGNAGKPEAEESPLLQTGLAFAGANGRAETGPDDEDGILTAEEAAGLDLRGVEWVVLSACDTGLGRVEGSEGVFGLRRAFRVAGARTLITSLWGVEDEAGREWMRGLYRARWGKGMRTAESVREASLEVLRRRRSRGESTHPFYWGSFVGSGEWR